MNKCEAGEAFSKATTDKGYAHGYDVHYDRIFENFEPKSLLEIGIKQGSSLLAWRYMFPDCEITGVDITKKDFSTVKIFPSRAKIIIGDATKSRILKKLQSNYDVIIDDGSHYYKDIMRTFKLLHTKFNKYYVIEDYFYDVDMAKKFLSNLGYHKVYFYNSEARKKLHNKSSVYRTSSTDKIIVNQKLVVIER